MAKKKTYCISANSKSSRSVDYANGELGTHAVVQVVGNEYIVVKGDITDPYVKHVITEHFHVNDDLDSEIQGYEL